MASHPYARAEPDLMTVRRIDVHFFAAVSSPGDEAG
jgi:hypothetical protein